MNETTVKHTPGPWRTTGNTLGTLRVKRDSDWATDIYTSTGKNHQCVCVAVQASTRDKKEAEANARLICAAPELLEALQFILSRLDDGSDRHCILYSDSLSPKDTDDQTVVEYLREAIAKAGGAL